jgi:hypothetical protein
MLIAGRMRRPAAAFCTLLFWGLELFRHRWVFVL